VIKTAIFFGCGTPVIPALSWGERSERPTKERRDSVARLGWAFQEYWCFGMDANRLVFLRSWL